MRENLKTKLMELLFGKTPGPKRQIYLDYIRVIATVFVIGVHTMSLASSMVDPEGASFYVLEIFDFIFLLCNLFFIMISGVLLLPVREEKLGTFFAKRFSKVAVPLVVYYVLYACAKEGFMWLRPSYWWVMFLRIIQGPSAETPHFWLVYVILGLYILTPFLRFLVQHIPDEVLAGVIGVFFLINTLDTYAPVFGMDAHLSVITDSFVGVFLLGYFLSEKCSKRAEDIFIIGGAVSFALSCFLILETDNYQYYIYENAPTMMLFASAVFLLVKRAAKNRTHESLFTRLICKYSFSILLIHWGVLHYFVKQMLHVDVLSFGIVGGCLLTMTLTLFFSVCGAIVIDNTVIRLIHGAGHLLARGVHATAQMIHKG